MTQVNSADEFCQAMFQQALVRKFLPRDVVAMCWTRAQEMAAHAPEESRATLALWYAGGMVQGLVWCVQALEEERELALVRKLWAQWVAPDRTR